MGLQRIRVFDKVNVHEADEEYSTDEFWLLENVNSLPYFVTLVRVGIKADGTSDGVQILSFDKIRQYYREVHFDD